MTATIETKNIKNLVILQGKIDLILDEPITCLEREEHIDFIIHTREADIQVVCRGCVGRDVIAMRLQKGDTVSVIGYLLNDSDLIVIADKVERV